LNAVGENALVRLSWTPAARGVSPISGYKIFRATVPGSAVSPNTFLAWSPGPLAVSFNDDAVTRGIGYCYRIRTVDTNGYESKDSNEACAIPPLPPYRGPLRVFPNPFDARTAVRGTVKFEGLPVGTKVRIYTSRGLKAWEGEVAIPFILEWNGRTKDNKPVAPGTYVWVAEGEGLKDRGTLIVE
jgi:hypothetical protein